MDFLKDATGEGAPGLSCTEILHNDIISDANESQSLPIDVIEFDRVQLLSHEAERSGGLAESQEPLDPKDSCIELSLSFLKRAAALAIERREPERFGDKYFFLKEWLDEVRCGAF
jgi:hypothetical protein